MNRPPRGWALLIGLGLWLAALAILNAAGLPQRADFTGLRIDGQTFAPEIGALAPVFALPTAAGESISLLDQRGAPVVVNFWATWCEPCAIELPELGAAAASGVRVIAINLREDPRTAENWLQSTGIAETAPAVIFVYDQVGTTAERYALRGQPSSYVIDAGGRIVSIFYGLTTRAALLNALP